MVPTDLGLPPKFSEWRVGQEDAVIDTAVALSGDVRFYVSSQPTGAGKSAWAMSVARMLGAKRTLILTITKPLALQYENDFRSMGLAQIKGQNNYKCIAVQPGNVLSGMGPPGTTVDEGPCHAGIECPLRQKGCAYFDDVRKALKSEVVVTNYDYWMYNNKFGDEPIGKFDLLILDEAHEAPEKLAEFVSIYISAEELHDLLGPAATLPPTDSPMEYWIQWAKRWLLVAKLELEEHRISKTSVRIIKRLRNLIGKLEDLSRAANWKRGNPSVPEVIVPGASTDWVAEKHGHGVLFSPVWAHGYAEQYLFNDIPRVILTSATIIPQTLVYLGLSGGYHFDERPSTFPVSRRPIYVLETAPSIRYEMTRGEELVWMNKIDYVLKDRLDRKSIIHAHSYSRAKNIYASSRYREHMVFHATHNLQQQVDRFRLAHAPSILVSPAVKAGWDFPYGQCELQIVAKVPFIPMQSAVIKARHKADKKYLNYLAVMTLIQEVGRGMRAVDDFCETFIIDGAIRFLLAANKKMFPRYFLRAVQWVDTIPPPPSIRARR